MSRTNHLMARTRQNRSGGEWTQNRYRHSIILDITPLKSRNILLYNVLIYISSEMTTIWKDDTSPISSFRFCLSLDPDWGERVWVCSPVTRETRTRNHFDILHQFSWGKCLKIAGGENGDTVMSSWPDIFIVYRVSFMFHIHKNCCQSSELLTLRFLGWTPE